MKKNCMMVLILLFCVCALFQGKVAHASGTAKEENSIYDALQKSIKGKWNRGMEEIEKDKQIEIKGNFTERVIRSIANIFYRNMKSIKAGSLFIGVLSIALGTLMAAVSKLNKGLKRFAIGVLVITVPATLLIFVFGISKFVSIFS